MFADTAMAKSGFYIEYSFAEPRYFVVDGHVSSEKMGNYDGINPDGVSPSDMDLGWFEPMDNTLFDLK
jgi:hypothetical protein